MVLRVLTYNIHRAIGLDRRFRPSRIVDILRHYDADLVLLQEVDDGAPRSGRLNLAEEIAAALEYPHYAFGHNVTLRLGRYGNATLSRYPIERERNIDLTIDDKKRRGCQHTTVRLGASLSEGSHSVEVFNLHLGLQARERERQIGRLLRCDEIESLLDHTPCLVAGDFNDWRSRLRPILVEGRDFRSATHREDELAGINTYPSISPQGPLDCIYYRGGLHLESARRCRLGVSKVASDHLPVIADFRLR